MDSRHSVVVGGGLGCVSGCGVQVDAMSRVKRTFMQHNDTVIELSHSEFLEVLFREDHLVLPDGVELESLGKGNPVTRISVTAGDEFDEDWRVSIRTTERGEES